MSSNAVVVRGAAWTVGTYALSVVIRFGSNVVLSRLLNPELLGALLLINTIRQGIELSSDVGLAQNVIQNRAGDKPAFFNTVWVMQILRGAILGAILFLCAVPIAHLYSVPSDPFRISAAILVVSGFASTSLFLLHRNMRLGKLNLFELAQDAIGAAIVITAAIVSPTIISVIFAALLSQIIRSGSSYFLTGDRNRFEFHVEYAREVFFFGRWIFLSSILAFLCASFDRLYIGTVAPLAVLGIYGIARTLAEVPTALAARIGYSVVFPVVSSAQSVPRVRMRAQLSSLRLKFLLISAVAVAFGISISDVAVKIIYDARYHDAAWMLPLLLFGVWLAILCAINEYALLGLGKPSYNVAGNGVKLAYYLTVLPLSYQFMGILGAILAIALSEIGRYLVISFGQRREQFSFLRQDAAATLVFFGLVVAMAGIRLAAGFGTAFDSVPLAPLSELWGRAF